MFMLVGAAHIWDNIPKLRQVKYPRVTISDAFNWLGSEKWDGRRLHTGWEHPGQRRSPLRGTHDPISQRSPVTLNHKPRPLTWLKDLLIRHGELPPERQRAVDLIAAIDAGGIPLNPARVNDIARKLGLDVPTTAPVEVTIGRIRKALEL